MLKIMSITQSILRLLISKLKLTILKFRIQAQGMSVNRAIIIQAIQISCIRGIRLITTTESTVLQNSYFTFQRQQNTNHLDLQIQFMQLQIEQMQAQIDSLSSGGGGGGDPDGIGTA